MTFCRVKFGQIDNMFKDLVQKMDSKDEFQGKKKNVQNKLAIKDS